MASGKNSHCGEGTSGMKKSAGKDNKSSQPLSNDECCYVNAELDATKNNLLSKIYKPTRTFWYMVRIFVIYADKEDLKWLENLLKEYKIDRDINNRPVGKSNKVKEEEYFAKQSLKIKLKLSEQKTIVTYSDMKIGYIFQDSEGQQLNISRESLLSKLTGNKAKSSDKVANHKISYEFIARLINWDDMLIHLRGISPNKINDILQKCHEEDCLEKIKIQMEKLDKKLSSYKRRSNHSLIKERKIELMYKECNDIRVILEKYNKYVSEKQHPYFMFH